MRIYDLTEEQLASPDIAVVGTAVRVPGARDVRGFWDNLAHARESVRALSEAELVQAGVSPNDFRAPSYVNVTSALDGIEQFDARFFGFSPREASVLDPQHRHFLEVCWEALEDAGVVPERFDGPVGVFGGSGMNAYLPFNLLTNPDLIREMGLFLVRHTGNDKDFLATRVSYCLNLRGPSVNVQTACSTSAVAIHLACQSLLSGECSLALAGGVTIELPHSRGYHYAEGEILSPDGRCRPFDANANGTVFASGAGVVALRRLSDAVRDGDFIHGIIKGSAVNNDGSRKPGYLAPSVDGQAECIAEALSAAGLVPEQISYVECHGTGTAVGDPIEVAGLREAFGAKAVWGAAHCGIGSLKSNIGHLDTAAGVAGLIKVLEMLKHERFVPTLHYEHPNPQIPFAETPFFVVAHDKPWPRTSSPRRAGVSSLGVGGTNAHIVLEEAPLRRSGAPAKGRPALLMLSARSQASLDQLGERLADQLEHEPDLDVADISTTLLFGRRQFPFCRVLAASTTSEACRLLRAREARRVFDVKVASKPRDVVFLFPGGGAQYPQMARALYESEPVFRARLDECFAILERREQLQLRPVVFPDPGSEELAQKQIERPSFALPALLAIELAYAAQLAAWGIKPVAMVGHSVGEYAAAQLASVLSLEDALHIVSCRGRLFETVKPGGMLSVALSSDELAPLLQARLAIAAINGPRMCVVAGENAELDALSHRLRERDVDTQRLHIEIAAHSPLLDPILETFARELLRVPFAAPRIPYASNLTGAFMAECKAPDASYFVQHLRNPVRFAECVQALQKAHPDAVFLEVGPGQGLSSLLRSHLLLDGGQLVVSVSPHATERSSDACHLVTALGRLWAHGVPRDLTAFFGADARRIVPLVTTPFDSDRHWVEPGVASSPSELRRADSGERDPARWLYAPVFRPAKRASANVKPKEHWWVLVESGALADVLEHELAARAVTATLIVPSERGGRDSAGRYGIALDDPHAFDALLAERGAPTRVLYTLCLRDKRGDTREASINRSFFTLLHLLQAFSREELAGELQLLVATMRAYDVAGTTTENPLHALALGPVLVAPRELSGLHARIFDLEDARDPELCARSLVDELCAVSEQVVVAERGRTRYAEVVESVSAEAGTLELPEAPVFLFTGGTGGIALTLAQHAAQRYGARLVLLSRSRLEDDVPHENSGPLDPELTQRRAAITALKEAGVEVSAIQADVTSREALERALETIRARFGHIDVVVHAAGAIDDGPLALKTRASARGVLAPKLDGTEALIEALSLDPPQHWIAISSVSAAIGPPGQIDYVAANAYANARARSLAVQWPHTRVISLGFGVWREIGMAVRLNAAGAPHLSGKPTSHPLLGHEVRLANGNVEFHARYRAHDLWVLDEHRVRGGAAVFPGTGFLELFRAAGARFLDVEASCPLEIQDVVFLKALRVDDEETQEIRIRRTSAQATSELVGISIMAKSENERSFVEHARASVKRATASSRSPLSIGQIESATAAHTVTFEEGLQRLPQDRALSFGARWKVLREMRLGSVEALARLELPASYRSDLDSFCLHPGMVDIATGFAFALADDDRVSETRVRVPAGYERVRIFAPLEAELWVHVQLREHDRVSGAAIFDATFTDSTGRVLVEVDGYDTRSVTPAALRTERRHQSTETLLEQWIRQGITRAEGACIFATLLRSSACGTVYASPQAPRVLESQLRAQSEPARSLHAAPGGAAALTSESRPRDDVEQALAELWQQLLGVEQVSRHHDFFDLGGHSLIAVRLFSRIKKTFGVDLSLSVLLEAPTLEGAANAIREALGRASPTLGDEGSLPELAQRPVRRVREERFEPLVMIQPGSSASRLFCVHGAGGNVLNFRELARGLGTEQTFFGLQAHGVNGEEPLGSIEEMAGLYLQSARRVQPRGPYLLAGYSGGGVIAYEMAQRLLAAGEQVALLAFIDTFHPATSPRRPSMRSQLERALREGLRATARRLRDKRRRERDEETRGRELDVLLEGAQPLPLEFRDMRLTRAFLEASERYRPKPYLQPITLFRACELADVFNHVGHKLGWDELVPRLRIVEVPGGHDTLLRAPNVQVLTAELRFAIDQATRTAPAIESAQADKARAV